MSLEQAEKFIKSEGLMLVLSGEMSSKQVFARLKVALGSSEADATASAAL